MADLVKRDSRSHGVSRASRQDRGRRVEYLAFRLADDVYAAPVSLVREILKPPPLTEVPRAPHPVLGIISVRGLLVTVVDLRRRLRLPEQTPTRRSRILLAEGAQREVFGLFVDEVLQVYRLAEDEIEAAAPALGGDVAEHIAGIARPRAETRAGEGRGGRVQAIVAALPGAVTLSFDRRAAPPAPAPTPTPAPGAEGGAASFIILLDLRAILGAPPTAGGATP